MRKFDDRDAALTLQLQRISVPNGLTDRVLARIRERLGEQTDPLGFDIAASASGIVRVRVGRGETEASSARAKSWTQQAREEIFEYLAGVRSYFSVPVDLSAAAPFQRAVLESAREIPFGAIRSYRWVAERIGRRGAVRAAGKALGGNPVPLLIPCHRVVRSDGGLGGYIFGLSLKSRLLQIERETPALVGCSSTRIICRHGCSREKRTAESRRIVFASVRDAQAVGYRPCKVCRPADPGVWRPSRSC